MPVTLPTDDQLDPLEQADLDEELPDANEEGSVPDEDPANPPVQPTSDLDPEIVEEIKRVMVDDELVEDSMTVKSKGHMISQDLINRPLDPSKDLWDEDGSI